MNKDSLNSTNAETNNETHINKVSVSVVSEFLDEQSDSEKSRFVHAYHVTLVNNFTS